MISRIVLPFFILLMSLNPLFAEQNQDLKKILKNDLLSKRKAEQKIKSNKRTSKVRTNKNTGLFNQKNIEQIISDLWLIKNNQVLKWDIKLPDYGINDVFENIFKAYGVKGVKYRILFVHSNSITHDVIKTNGNELTFIISKVLAEHLDLTKQEICMLLLESYIRNELLSKNVKFEKFSFDDRINLKKSLNKYIESRIKSLDNRLFDLRSSFEREDKVLKRIYTNLSNNTNLISTYKRLQEKINESVKGDVRFRFYAVKYPSPEIKLQWLEGMNVR